MKLILNDCCGVVSLKTTCLIIGYFNLVIKLLISAFLIVTITVSAIVPASDSPGFEDTTAQLVGALIAAICTVWLFFVMIDFIFTIVLLVGLHKHKRLHIKVFLIYSVVFWNLSIIMFFVHIEQINAPIIYATLAVCVTKIYGWLVIRSYYKTLCEMKSTPPIV